ncbi:copper amine oxidase [Streptomyces sp. SAJ15]|uniref:copper amine oxidase n=1 Tax=Streptomyces sp. SAJ15 TaxID=2011095 RepID=UPI001186E271|nr:copper amine oxidase [Streptomyces sp. SAJ15]TVL92853.1 copper amine oxidase [Streptomyces sp. SAJ15]
MRATPVPRDRRRRLARGRRPALRLRALSALALALPLAAGGAAVGPARALPPTARPPSAAAPAAPAAACGDPYRIEQRLTGGTVWRMCWSYESHAGLVLKDVTYQPRGEPRPIKVLTSAKLAQIHVPYDDGSVEYDDLTGQGFAQGLQQLDPAECPGGTIKTVRVRGASEPSRENVAGLCATTRARGHAYRMVGADAGEVHQVQDRDLLVYTVNLVGWYEYITEWRFSSDGAMTMQVGATGSLSPIDYDAGDGRGWPLGRGAGDYATSHSHNVFWRLNFGLDGSSKSVVEQYDSTTTQESGRLPRTRTTRTRVTRELAGDAVGTRWWRVVSTAGRNADGHPRSYEIVPGRSTRYQGRPYTRHDVYVTEYRGCEQFASHNLRDCGARAGRSVDTWVDGQTLEHPVVWVHIGFHHIARDEDQQPMPVHWQGFQLAPRDVTAMNPLTPPALAGHNGHTEAER